MTSERPFYIRLLLVVYTAWLVIFQAVGRYAATLPTHDPTTALDRLIPLVPEAVWLYDFCFILPLVVLFVVHEGHLLNRAVIAIFVSTISASVVYLSYPVAYPLPELGSSLSDRVLAYHYMHDFRPGANKMPSLHVANSWMIWLAVRESGAGSKTRLIFLVLALTISISTLLVKQHIVPDVLLGFAWAFPSWWLAGTLYARLNRYGLSGADTVRALWNPSLRARSRKPLP